MAPATSDSATSETARITVRYWASARAAAGVATDDLPVDGPTTLADVVRRALALHPDAPRLPDVLHGARSWSATARSSAEDPDEVVVGPGSSVEFLPPFAGG